MPDALTISIADLAAERGVNPSAVFRELRSRGLAGFVPCNPRSRIRSSFAAAILAWFPARVDFDQAQYSACAMQIPSRARRWDFRWPSAQEVELERALQKVTQTAETLRKHGEFDLAVFAIYRSIEWCLKASFPAIAAAVQREKDFNLRLVEECLKASAQLKEKVHQMRKWANRVRHPNADPGVKQVFNRGIVTTALKTYSEMTRFINQELQSAKAPVGSP